MTTRDRAYAVVKKMKAAYLAEGCDWQTEIEKTIETVRRDTIELCVSIANKHIKNTRESSVIVHDLLSHVGSLELLRNELVRLNEVK